MITITILCPHCQQAEPVIKYGSTGSKTQRAKCKDCDKTFSINPKSRAVNPEKREAILRQLVETLPEFKESVLPSYKRGEQPKRWGDSFEFGLRGHVRLPKC